MRVVICVLTLTFCASAYSPEMALFPPDTSVVMGVRVRQLAPTLQAYSSAMPAPGGEWLKAVSALGFDPLRDIDEILVASPASSQNAPALIVAHGAFGSVRMPAADEYRGVPFWQTGKGSPFAIALLDGETAIAGTPEVVRAAIDRRGGALSLNAPLQARVDRLRSRYDVWGAGDQPGGLALPSNSPQNIDSIDSFEFGMNASDGLQVEAEFHARDPKQMEQFAQSIRFFETAMRAQQPNSDAAKMELRQEGGSLKLSVAISADEMRRASGGGGAALPGLAAIMQPRAAAPEPPPVYMGAPGSQVLAPNGDTRIVTLPGAR